MSKSDEDYYNPKDMDGEAFRTLLEEVSSWRLSLSGLQRQSESVDDDDDFCFPQVALERRSANKNGSLWFIPPE